MMNWGHLQDLTAAELIQRVIVGEENQQRWNVAFTDMKQRAESAEAELTKLREADDRAWHEQEDELHALRVELAKLKGHADAMSNMIRGFIFKTVERETLADSASAYRKWEEDYCHRHGRAAYPKE